VAAETLIAHAAAKPRPIAELAAFSRALGPEGGDVLLLPEGFDFAPDFG